MISESVRIRDCDFYMEVSGTGDPLVLLHGFGWDSSAWDDQFDAFADHFTVIRYDLRGFGRSVPEVPEPYSHHDDLAAVIQHLGFRSVHLLGHSLGGYVALDFALANPESTASLVLADPAIGGYQWSQDLVNASFVTPPRLANEEGIDAARQAWLRFPPFQNAMSDPALAKRITEMVERYSGWHWFNPGLAIQTNEPAIQHLSEIDCPTLVLIGGDNHADYLEAGHVLEEGISGSVKTVIPGVAHALPMEDPDRFNDEVLGFLNPARRHMIKG